MATSNQLSDDPIADEAWQERFSGIQRLYGDAASRRLARSHFAVVGLGGVGGWVAEALARSGVGALTLIDPDTIALSNINRQPHTLATTCGQRKVAVMAERIAAIHPHCRLTCQPIHLDEENIAALIGECDAVIDCIDAVRAKAALIAWALRHRTPLVTTGGAGGLIDPLRITVADLGRTQHDPLAAKVRQRLRHHYGIGHDRRVGVDCVFSTEQHRYPQGDGTVCQRKPALAGLSLDCASGYGAATFITATFGMIAVARTIETLLRRAPRHHR
jgi:tRNA threonylcarbamoyladenosine dehydratase